MERSGFFDANLVSGTYDRKYVSQDFADYFATFISNGVFGDQLDELMVVASNPNAMNITLKPGRAFIGGRWYENDKDMVLAIGTANGTYARIDNVVIHWNKNNREIRAEVVEGIPSVSPSAPELRRTDDDWDLKLAEITVAAGAITINQGNIVDTRDNVDVCGFVKGMVDQISASDYINNALAVQKEAFDAWFDNLEYQLSGDVAGNLQLQIDELMSKVVIADGNTIVRDEQTKEISVETSNIDINSFSNVLDVSNGGTGFSSGNFISNSKVFNFVDIDEEKYGLSNASASPSASVSSDCVSIYNVSSMPITSRIVTKNRKFFVIRSDITGKVTSSRQCKLLFCILDASGNNEKVEGSIVLGSYSGYVHYRHSTPIELDDGSVGITTVFSSTASSNPVVSGAGSKIAYVRKDIKISETGVYTIEKSEEYVDPSQTFSPYSSKKYYTEAYSNYGFAVSPYEANGSFAYSNAYMKQYSGHGGNGFYAVCENQGVKRVISDFSKGSDFTAGWIYDKDKNYIIGNSNAFDIETLSPQATVDSDVISFMSDVMDSSEVTCLDEDGSLNKLFGSSLYNYYKFTYEFAYSSYFDDSRGKYVVKATDFTKKCVTLGVNFSGNYCIPNFAKNMLVFFDSINPQKAGCVDIANGIIVCIDSVGFSSASKNLVGDGLIFIDGQKIMIFSNSTLSKNDYLGELL